ncbi:MAG TPA: GntP family permease [bacterium]|nr:GntP family permease [bacterium]
MSGIWLLVILLLAIVFIIYGTAGLKWHPFLVLLLASYAVGLVAGLPASATIQAITDGFGGTLGSIGIIIAAGTIIGSILAKSGGTIVMANTVIRWIGEARSALAMSITGAVVSIPVFCDSGFVILSPLNNSLAARAKKSVALYAVALSMGLYSTHVFVPPTPGPIAAAGVLNADLGSVILLGIITTVPVIIVTYLFARYMGNRIYIDPEEVVATDQQQESDSAPDQPVEQDLPRPILAFLPILVPMLLIALRSVAEFPGKIFGEGTVFAIITFFGDPNTALILGVLLVFLTVRERGPHVYRDWVGTGLKNAGTIILITGAGGALGSVLRATPIGDYLGNTLANWNIGIFLPFLIAAAMKTAQGSSTVSIITTASIVTPLLSTMGLAGGMGPVLVTLAIGAGAMTVSHANDSYFWVVSQFSGMDVSQAYRLQTVSSGLAGVTGIIMVFVLSLLR